MKVNPKKGSCGGNCGGNSGGGNCGSGSSSCGQNQKKKSNVRKHTPALCPIACMHGSHTNASVRKNILILLAPEDRKIANGDVAFVFIYKSAKESFTVLMVMDMYCREKILRAWCLEDKRFHIDCARSVAFDDVDIMKKEVREKIEKMKTGRFDYP